MAGFADYITTTLSAIVFWNCEEASGGLVDSGSLGQNLSAIGSAVYEQADTVTYESGKAVLLDGSDYFVATADAATIGTGTIGVFFRIQAGADLEVIFDQASFDAKFTVRIQISPTLLACDIDTNGVLSHYRPRVTSGLALGDNAWHLVTFVQPGDTGGVRIYLDGSPLTVTHNLIGSGDKDDFYDTVFANTTAIAVGATASSGNGFRFVGDVSTVFVTATAMSITQNTTLWALTTALSAPKTTRRDNRRTYTFTEDI